MTNQTNAAQAGSKNDIAQRLRDQAGQYEQDPGYMVDAALNRAAADEIERLRAERKLRAPVADGLVPAMPPTKDRGPSDFEGYTESDYDWNRSNPGALTWLADNHAAIRAALASAPVAGEAQIIGYVPPLYLEMRRRGMPVNSKIQHSPGDDATAPLYAAPQASAEDVRKPIMTVAEFCTEADRIGLTADTLAAQLAQRPEFADCLPQADKDGGQQREGVVTDDMRHAVRFAPSSAHWSERLVEFFGPDAREGIDALERQLREARAALSAPQAEQGERDAD